MRRPGRLRTAAEAAYVRAYESLHGQYPPRPDGEPMRRQTIEYYEQTKGQQA